MFALLVWGRTVTYDFVWDDQTSIVQNTNIRSAANIPKMFYSKDAQGIWVFRPLRTLQYAALFAIGAKPTPQPWIYHLANVLWHAAAGILFFFLLCEMFKHVEGAQESAARLLAVLLAIGFVVHPVTSEVVCWAKGLDDLMATVFILAACLCLFRWRGEKGTYLAALIWFALAVYSKESTVPFAVGALLIFHFIHGVPWRRTFVLSAGFAAVAGLFVVHQHFVMGQTSQCDPISGSYWQTLFDMLAVFPKYCRLALGIPPFCIDYSFMPGGLTVRSPEALAGICVLIAAAGVFLCARQRKLPLVLIGLVWVGLFLLPVMNLAPMMQYMAERFLYLPLLGFLMLVGGLTLRTIGASDKRMRLSALMIVAVIGVWTTASLHRMGIWKDEVTLFVRSCAEGPRCKRIEHNAVAAVFDLPYIHEAFPYDPKTFRLDRIGNISPQNAPMIAQMLASVHEIIPDDPALTTALGIAYSKNGQHSQGIQLLETVARHYPTNYGCWKNLATARAENADWAGASAALQMAFQLKPNDAGLLKLQAKLEKATQKDARP